MKCAKAAMVHISAGGSRVARWDIFDWLTDCVWLSACGGLCAMESQASLGLGAGAHSRPRP